MAAKTLNSRGHAELPRQRPARVRRIAELIGIVAAVPLLLSACGGSGGQQSSAGPRQWSAAAVVRLAGLRRAPDLSYHLSAHPQCATLVLLRSTAEVASYKGSGDAIVTNPDRSAGADVTTASPACRRLFKQALSHVR